MLHSRLLSYLDEVARLGSMRKASARLNVASSAINRQILALEAELGTPLFLRLPRKLMLTTAGEIMIRHVRQTLKDMERVQTLMLIGSNRSADALTSLLVEQNTQQALRICGQASVLVNGHVEMSGPAEELTDRRAMLASFLGQKDAATDTR